VKTILFTLLMVAFVAYPQVSLVKTYQGIYATTTVKAASALTASDTTQYVTVPYGVQALICYVQADTISASDTLNITIQGSLDGVKWKTDSTFAEIRAAGTGTVVLSNPSPYIRFIEAVTGTSIRHYRSIKVFPR
jgi:hypothetical protein